MSTRRTKPGGWAVPDGRCRQCGIIITAKRRSTFCSPECVHQWKLRTNAGYLRYWVEQRDHGVCAVCGTDTEVLGDSVMELWRRKYPGLPFSFNTVWIKKLWCSRNRNGKRRLNGLLAWWGIDLKRVKHWELQLWDADHIVPVHQGGGECGLDNIQTLCWRCHKIKTKKERT